MIASVIRGHRRFETSIYGVRGTLRPRFSGSWGHSEEQLRVLQKINSGIDDGRSLVTARLSDGADTQTRNTLPRAESGPKNSVNNPFGL